MTFNYYYGLVIDLMVFSNWNNDIVFWATECFNDPNCNWDNFYDSCAAQCSMAIDYYETELGWL